MLGGIWYVIRAISSVIAVQMLLRLQNSATRLFDAATMPKKLQTSLTSRTITHEKKKKITEQNKTITLIYIS